MPSIEIIGTGRSDDRDSAFPLAVQLPDGDILCSFSVGGGPHVHGGTDFARSRDGGRTWTLEGTILPPGTEPPSTNFLKLTLSPDGRTIYAYGARLYRKPGWKFGEGQNDAVLCASTDNGRTWSGPSLVPFPCECATEVSYGALALASGRLLAPAATLPAQDRLGEKVLVAISDDGGKTWKRHAVVFRDPEKRLGYFEHKLAEIAPGRVMAVCWTVTLGDAADRPDSFAISNDGGETWGPARSTGIMGQTMTPVSLGGDRLLVLYNRRYGDQGIVMNLVTFTDQAWTLWYEGIMYDARAKRTRSSDVSGLDELETFEFGFPTAIRLRDGTLLATHWCKEGGKFGIRWTKLRADW
jgi:hypothetical protein